MTMQCREELWQEFEAHFPEVGIQDVGVVQP